MAKTVEVDGAVDGADRRLTRNRRPNTLNAARPCQVCMRVNGLDIVSAEE